MANDNLSKFGSVANSTPQDASAWQSETQLVQGGVLRSQFGETSEALFLTQGFVYASAEQAEARFKNEDPGFQYSRFGNPTVAMLEERLKLLEGAEDCRTTATGMAAVTAAILSCLSAGDHIVAARAMFGSCRYIVEELCPRFGITPTLIDGRDLAAWRASMRHNTKAVFFETPANPTLELVDIAAVCEIAHAAGAVVIVDNVFATPMLQKPLKLGADVVVYSATKHIDGQGRCLGGAVLASAAFIKKYVHDFVRQTGPAMSPFNAWVMLKSLETLPLRVAAQVANAERIADHLAGLGKGLAARFASSQGTQMLTGLPRPVLNAFAADYTKREMMALLNEIDVPCGPIMGTEDLVNDEHVRLREMVVELDHPERGPWLNVGMPIKLSDSSVPIERSPLLGEHTDEVLRSVLELDEERIAALRSAGAFSKEAPRQK